MQNVNIHNEFAFDWFKEDEEFDPNDNNISIFTIIYKLLNTQLKKMI